MRPLPHPPTRRGFTLIELLIAIVIIAVLAAVALPSFFGQIRKARRSDAIATVASIQQAQERWRANNATYNTTAPGTAPPAGLGVTPPTVYYTYASSTPASATTASGYGIAATAVAGSSQSKDAGCQYLRADVIGGNVTYVAGTTSATAVAGAAANTCWRR